MMQAEDYAGPGDERERLLMPSPPPREEEEDCASTRGLPQGPFLDSAGYARPLLEDAAVAGTRAAAAPTSASVAVEMQDFSAAECSASKRGDGAEGAEAGECRICQEVAEPGDPLEAPCTCSGSMRFIHRSCLQKWINLKGDTVCEVCHQPFTGNFSVPALPLPVDLMDLPTLGHLLERARMHEAASAIVARRMAAERGRYAASTSASCTWVRLTVVVIMSLLFLRLFFLMADSAAAVETEATEAQAGSYSGPPPSLPTLILIFVLRVVGPLIPFLLLYRAVAIVRLATARRHLERDADGAELAAVEVAWLLRHGRGADPSRSPPRRVSALEAARIAGNARVSALHADALDNV